MKKRKYYYLVECANGINHMTTFQHAENHLEAEKLAENEYFEKYLSYPVDVESRKSTKAERDYYYDDDYDV